MLLLDQTLHQPEMNLALDEALLEEAEHFGWITAGQKGEVLRFWEPAEPIVVLGRSSPIQREVNLEYCRQRQIPVLRRCSGGATIVTGPGCLMYALLISYRDREELRFLDQAHQFVMGRMQRALATLKISVTFEGTCDLAIDQRKVSGNSLRCRRHGFLYHGTMICNFDLSLVSQALNMPVRQPDYRQGRGHDSFLTQLPVSQEEVKFALAREWGAVQNLEQWPVERARNLATEKYRCPAWTHQVR